MRLALLSSCTRLDIFIVIQSRMVSYPTHAFMTRTVLNGSDEKHSQERIHAFNNNMLKGMEGKRGGDVFDDYTLCSSKCLARIKTDWDY
jgi:hypothetical protein